MQNALEDILPGSSNDLERQCRALYLKYWEAVHGKEMDALATICSEEDWTVIGHAGSSYLHYWRSRIKMEREKAERQRIQTEKSDMKHAQTAQATLSGPEIPHDSHDSNSDSHSDSDASFMSSASHSRSKYECALDEAKPDPQTEHLQPSLSASLILRQLTNYYIHSSTFVEISTRILSDLTSLVEYYASTGAGDKTLCHAHVPSNTVFMHRYN